ncbi:MAG TPA: DUF2914 domain-containing protein, partial [Myxococcota bacterium]|nr:DUF2914 domain-containing protein [Myxococcota bacterium]
MRWDTFTRRFSPWISLALGVATVLFFRRGLSWAPLATGILLVAWVLASVFSRRLGREGAPGEPPETRGRRLLRSAVRSLVASLYQNVLFFLVPMWFFSATWGSANLAMPALLAAMAVFSCFELPYTNWVIEHRAQRTVWSSVVLFASLVPAGPALLAEAPLRQYVAIAAFAATASGILVGLPDLARRFVRLGALALLAGAGAAALMFFAAPFLPPVPVQCMDAGLGTEVRDRELLGAARQFPEGTERVYAWFAVAAPDQFDQAVRFVWSREGERIGRPFDTAVTGGRQAGYRTWSYAYRPWPGRWRVELQTDEGQLIGRREFTVVRGRLDAGGARAGADGA